MEIKATLNKPYTDKQRINFIVKNNHQLGYEIRETNVALEAWGADNYDLLNRAKQNKILENDSARDNALLQGVTYKDVLFDSDTDQKVNLLAIVSTMGDEDEITWFGKDNQPLLCNKQDLINIGGLITVLHNHCWTLNASIKGAINEAQTIEEVETIVIDYTMPVEESENIEESEEINEG